MLTKLQILVLSYNSKKNNLGGCRYRTLEMNQNNHLMLSTKICLQPRSGLAIQFLLHFLKCFAFQFVSRTVQSYFIFHAFISGLHISKYSLLIFLVRLQLVTMPLTSYITLDKPQVSQCKMRLIIITIKLRLLHNIVRTVLHKAYI